MIEEEIKVRGTFIALVILHYELIKSYGDADHYVYKGISIVRDGEDYVLKYQLINKNNTYGQSENYKRSEFFTGTQGLLEMGEREVR